MSRTDLILLAVLLAPPALAETRCEPIDETAFRSLALDAQAAVDRGDVELSTAVVEETLAAVPCLTFAPAPREWADFLVVLAIVEFARGGAWEPPLTTALQIRPLVDRGVASGHPLAAFVPLPPGPPGASVPEGSVVYVDGTAATVLPGEGLHLVQRTDGRFWNTLLVTGPPPQGWVGGKVEQPPRIAGWATVGALFGGGANLQTPSWSGDWIERREDEGVAFGAAVDVAVTFFSPFGFAFSGAAPIVRGTADVDGRVAGIWTTGGLLLGAGVGTHAVDTWEGDARRVTMLRYGFGTAHLRAGRRWRWDAGLTFGAGGALRRTALRLGVAPPEVGGARWRAGIDILHARGSFVQVGAPERSVDVDQTRLVLQLGVALGEY